jgi:hypothetical protein
VNHREFHDAVKAFAAGRYCSSMIDVTTDSYGNTSIEYKVYVDGLGPSVSARTGELVLASLAAPSVSVDSLGEPPEPHAAPVSAVNTSEPEATSVEIPF